MEVLAKLIYKKRTEKGWSQRDLVKNAKVSLGAIQAIESNSTQNPGIATLLALAKALMIREEDILLAFKGIDPDKAHQRPRDGLVKEILERSDQLSALSKKLAEQDSKTRG